MRKFIINNGDFIFEIAFSFLSLVCLLSEISYKNSGLVLYVIVNVVAIVCSASMSHNLNISI